MDEFCTAKLFKLFISGFTLSGCHQALKSLKKFTPFSYMQLRQLIKTSLRFCAVLVYTKNIKKKRKTVRNEYSVSVTRKYTVANTALQNGKKKKDIFKLVV